MAFEHLERHLLELGGVDASPIPEAEQAALAAEVGATVSPALAWWWARVGAGRFREPVVYFDPEAEREVVIGWCLSAEETRQAIEDYGEALGPRRLPVVNDGADNFLVVDGDGSVHQHLHDAPLDRNSYRVASSFERFVASLRKGG